MAVTYDSTTLVVSSANLGTNQYEVKLFDISNFGLEPGESPLTSFAQDADPYAKVAPAVAVSRDNQQLYAYYPADTKLVTYNIANMYTGVTELVVAGASPGPGHYLGTSNGNVVLVDSHKLYLFEKDNTGALALLNTSSITTTSEVSAATGDPTGKYVLAVVFQTVYVFDVDDGGIVLSQTVSTTTGSGKYDNSPYITMSKDSTSVYVGHKDLLAVVLLSATYDESTEVLTLHATSSKASPGNRSTEYAMAHPDGSVLYAGSATLGQLSQYERIPSDGSLPGHASSDHASSNYASSDHASSDHASSNHTSSDHTSSDHASTFSSFNTGYSRQSNFDRDHITREFDHGCEIGRLLDRETMNFFGQNTTACRWSIDSSQAIVFFNETSVSTWDPPPNITLMGGYIYGVANSSSTVQPTAFAEGKVELALRQPAPELIEARFSDDGASVRVSFSPDGSASSGLLNASDPGSGSGPGSCDALLRAATVAVIGNGAECEWTGLRELTVRIGFDPVAVADSSMNKTCSGENSCITLLEGGVRTEAFAVLSSSGSTPILGPVQPARISAVLVAPQEVGLCGEFNLDGRASSGSSSRALSGEWHTSAATIAGGSALAAVEQALVPFQGSLLATLNATALEIGVEFSFTLAVSNFLGAADDTTVTVTRMNDDVPTVVIIGSATRAVKRNRFTTLKMAASPPACEEASSLAYTWAESGVGGYDKLGTAFEDLLGSDPTTLVIPPYALDYPGSSYHFKASSTLRSSTTSASAYVEVTVVQGGLRAFISGGQFRQHTIGADLVLDGSGSSDDDDIPESEFPLTYMWSCSQNCSGVADEYTSSEEPIFIIPGGNLQGGLVYEFSLNVTKGTADSGVVYGLLRSDVATVSIELVSFEAPEVVVATSDSGGLKLDPTRKIVIYGGVVEHSNDVVGQSSDLLWTQMQGDLNIETEDWSVFFASPRTGVNLVIRANILTGGSTYTFRLSAVDTVSLAKGFAELSILANAAPSGGYIEATPRLGVAALDTFYLECLSWSDDVDDLPLTFSFSTQDDAGVQHAISVSKSQSPEWRGPLPIGQAVDNYTMNIVGHISDGYGATATSLTDASGESVTVRVTGWETPPSSNSMIVGLPSTLVEAYTVAAEVAQYNPGETTSVVRAFASLLMDEINGTPLASPEETNGYQALAEVMINAAVADFGVLDYSPTSAAAVLDTLALLSSNGDTLGTESQGILLGSSASILDQALEDGYWDEAMKVPTLQVLDGVIGTYSSGSIVSSEEIGDDAAVNISRIVESMTLLMEAGMVDGEEVGTIESDYVQAACLVTSSTERIRFATGSSAVTFEAGAIITSPGLSSRRTTVLGQPQVHAGCASGGCASKTRQAVLRRLDQEQYTSSSTIIVTQLGFSANGRASSVVEAGVTQIKVTSTSSGEDVPLAAPVTMLMRASVASTEEIPSCSYYNEETGFWESSGLVIDSIQELSVGESGDADVLVSCLTFHLSDFTVTTTEVEPIFQPIALTAGTEIFRAFQVSSLGLVLTAIVLCVMVAVWGCLRAADRRAKMAEKLEVKVVDWYIATGKPKRRPTLPDLLGPANTLVRQRRRHRKSQSLGRRLWHRVKDRFEAWYHSSRVVGLHIVEYHPWGGILKPSRSNLTLTRGQLSILIFAQVMVQMMVEACFQGNSTDPRVKTTQIVVGLAATLPASIIIPAAFTASTSPPASVTVHHDWQHVVFDAGSGRPDQEKASEQIEGGNRWLREPNYILAVYYLVVAKVRQKLTPGSQAAHSTKAGGNLARGTDLVISGVANLFLSMTCGILCIVIGVDSNLDTALAATVFCSHIQNLLSIDVLLSNKATMFSTINFGGLFNLVFAGVGLTTLQVVLAFYGRQEGGNALLYGVLAGMSIVKLGLSTVGELVPCMDAMNEHSITQLGYAKRYHRRSSAASRGVSDRTHKRIDTQRRAATVIQSRVRLFLFRKRIIRRKEVQAWHGDSVKSIREKINNRAYVFLITYTLVVVWINLCYVATYDAPTIWRWTAATSATVLIDVLLRKPISVLMMSALHTIRDMHAGSPGTKKMAMFSGRGTRTPMGTFLLYAYVCLLLLVESERVSGSPLSNERYQVTTFGAERRAQWSLEGKTAVVTGGTKGIGKAVVEELACLGARVLTCSRNSADVAACLEEWKSKGLIVHGTAADVTTAEGREALVKLVQEHFGGLLDILVNNVGTNIRKATIDYTPEEYAHVMDTNFTSLFLLTQLLYPFLKAAAAVKGAKESGGSSVVNISSVAGLTSIKSGTPYAASKAAMNQVTRNWGCEWASDGIRVNVVAPWYTETPLTEPVKADASKLAEILQRTPMGRWAEADEVSGIVAFLCMKGAAYITSQVISTDGGFTANGWMT
eukprot:g12026.t1